ncbi:NaeI family type II restriction endonuclease [Brevundimonas sp. BR2-1]|uniref:NaeI family type II restriction endonuclease n=1 Tax=Brevundimonas sp. BR2-1 TaxID=3031123 RepID=UPI00309E256C
MSAFPLPDTHPDYAILAPLAAGIENRAGGAAGLKSGLPPLFRQAVDEVIDAPRTNRFTISELEKTEKTYLGTKIEILLRDFLKLPKGKILDLSIDGVEVDIKNTMQRAWTIPLESHGHPALLLRLNETAALCDAGLVVVRPAYLNAGQNRDAKKTLSAAGTFNIWWLLRRHPYPPNFWEVLPAAARQEIFAAGSASARLALLFAKLQRQPVSRLQVQAVAQQHDYMKRLRRNGGARDLLLGERIALLSGRTDAALITALRLGPVSVEEFISLTPETDEELALLTAAGQLS